MRISWEIGDYRAANPLAQGVGALDPDPDGCSAHVGDAGFICSQDAYLVSVRRRYREYLGSWLFAGPPIPIYPSQPLSQSFEMERARIEFDRAFQSCAEAPLDWVSNELERAQCVVQSLHWGIHANSRRSIEVNYESPAYRALPPHAPVWVKFFARQENLGPDGTIVRTVLAHDRLCQVRK